MKIVELLIDWENMEMDDLGVSIMSLVDKPAIRIGWQAFSDESEDTEAISNRIIEMMESDQYGESYDPAETVVIGYKQEKFSTIGEFLRGVIGLDILGRQDANEEPEIKYLYSGPSASRNFCKAMLRMNKVYTRKEIEEMSASINTGFRHDGQAYSIFEFKGGVNCKHLWMEVQVFKKDGRAVIVEQGPVSGRPGEIANARNNYWRFEEIEDERIVTGPAMTANVMIPRKDEMGNIFHVYFSEDTIKKIAHKFFLDKKQNITDVNHSNNTTTQNILLESWIVEDPKNDKSNAMGFSANKGDWYVSYKINDDETWAKIKSGNLLGFSVQGDFIEKAIKK